MGRVQRLKYGIFIHPATPHPQELAKALVEEIRESFLDPVEPSLGTFMIHESFTISTVEDEVLFSIEHRPENYQFFVDPGSGPIRRGILAALDWWNRETILLCPSDLALSWDPHELPNAWSRPFGSGFLFQNITQYPKRLGHRVLEAWNPGLLFFPLLCTYEEPSPEAIQASVQTWLMTQEEVLKECLPRLLGEPGGPWFITTSLHYRHGIAPNPAMFRPVGSEEEAAENAALTHGGLCFLVHAPSGEVRSRWANR